MSCSRLRRGAARITAVVAAMLLLMGQSGRCGAALSRWHMTAEEHDRCSRQGLSTKRASSVKKVGTAHGGGTVGGTGGVFEVPGPPPGGGRSSKPGRVSA